MERNQTHKTATASDDAIVETLLTPGEGSFVDALLALADDAANGSGPTDGRRALSGGFQAALARRMRAVIAQDDHPRDAA